MGEEFGSFIPKCPFSLTVESTDSLTRRAASGPSPLPDHLVIHVLHLVYMTNFREVGFYYPCSVHVHLDANMADEMKS
jgi:hypothetical protein